MLSDYQETQSLHETSLTKANSLPYGSRLSMANAGGRANSEVSVMSTTKDSMIYDMIAGNSPGGGCLIIIGHVNT